MSIFKKLFGKQQQEAARERVARAPRIRLSTIHNLILTSPRWDQKFLEVLNVSTTGLAFRGQDKPQGIEVGTTIPAMLTINSATLPVLLRVAQIGAEVVGCAFQGEIKNLQKTLFDYFIAEISGMEVNEVNPNLLKPDDRGIPRWFFGANNSEIYFTTEIVAGNHLVTYFHLTLLGNYLECYRDQAPKFGYVVTQEGKNKMKPDASPLIRFTQELSPRTTELFVKFVNHVGGLPKGVRTHVLSIIDELG